MRSFIVRSPSLGWEDRVEAADAVEARRIAMERRYGPARREIVGDRDHWNGDGLDVFAA